MIIRPRGGQWQVEIGKIGEWQLDGRTSDCQTEYISDEQHSLSNQDIQDSLISMVGKSEKHVEDNRHCINLNPHNKPSISYCCYQVRSIFCGGKKFWAQTQHRLNSWKLNGLNKFLSHLVGSVNFSWLTIVPALILIFVQSMEACSPLWYILKYNIQTAGLSDSLTIKIAVKAKLNQHSDKTISLGPKAERQREFKGKDDPAKI